ncbi:MAG: hypothetical protein OHK0046_19630 [Anaerolineae bacterium]
MSVTIINAPADSALALRMRGDLEANGVQVSSTLQERDVLVAVLSQAALADANVQQVMMQALENYQHVLPVLAEDVKIPRIIGNLETLDFSQRYSADDLLARVAYLASPNAPAPLTVLTPGKRAANRQAGLIVGGLALITFILALIGVGSGAIQAPEDEFASVETQIFLTRNYYIDEALPRSTEDAANFAATLEEVPGSAVPFLIQTATGIAAGVEGTFVPQNTLEATNFRATLRVVSTVVRERVEGRATDAAMTATLITSTPAPAITATPDATSSGE